MLIESSMAFELIRSLFPRWNFFDHISYKLELEVQQVGTKGWLPIAFDARRTIGGLFINPEVTRMHAEMSMLENFASDVQSLIAPDGRVDSLQVQKLTSFKMVRSFVMNKLMASPSDQVQFRLSARSGDEQLVVYTSDVIGAK